MNQSTEFTWEIFIDMADYLFYNHTGRPLTKLEKELLKCYWNRMSHQDILRNLNEKRSDLNHYYNDNYFHMGLEPISMIMKQFSVILGEPVNKKNFKEVFKRRWDIDNQAIFSQG